MPSSPDDLPRSATARIPQRNPAAVGVVLVVVLGVAAWLSTGSPGLPDRVVSAVETRLAPAPSAEVVALADAAHLSDDGRDLFYGTRPRILGAQAFAGECVDSQVLRAAAGGAVGCFQEGANAIVLYAPADPRLYAAVVEAAAHETLHAAWVSLSTDERGQLTETASKTTSYRWLSGVKSSIDRSITRSAPRPLTSSS